MNLHRYVILGAAVAALAACSNDNTAPTVVTPGPAALMRIINDVPDTGAVDFRFTDTVDGVPNVEFVNLPFRGGTDRGYQRVSVGSHHIRVFMSGSNANSLGQTNDPAIVSTVMGDTTFTFVEGVHYTIVWYGSARAKTAKLAFIPDNFVPPASGKVAIRALNATGTAADFYVNAGTAALTTVTGTPTWANVAGPSDTGWQEFATASSSSNYVVSATPAGAVTPVWSTVCPTGSAAVAEVSGVSGALAATAGCRVSGSVLSAILFPISTAGSKAPSFTTQAIVFLFDKQP